jgi:hypothetical protein
MREGLSWERLVACLVSVVDAQPCPHRCCRCASFWGHVGTAVQLCGHLLSSFVLVGRVGCSPGGRVTACSAFLCVDIAAGISTMNSDADASPFNQLLKSCILHSAAVLLDAGSHVVAVASL